MKDLATIIRCIEIAQEQHRRHATWDYDTGPDIIAALKRLLARARKERPC